STVDIVGKNFVGGLVGYNTNSISTAFVIADITASSYAGGIAGYHTGVIDNTYAVSVVVADLRLGALLGYKGSEATMTASYYNIDILNNASEDGSGRNVAKEAIGDVSGSFLTYGVEHVK